MTDGARTPSKYNPAIVAQVILEVTVELHPRCLTSDDLSRRIVADPEDRREVEAAMQAIRNLEQAACFAPRMTISA
jgi:hypothetical protein